MMLFLDLWPLPLPHSNCILVYRVSLKISCPELANSKCAWHHLDSGRDRSLPVGLMGSHSSQWRTTASSTQPWQHCASQLHLAQQKAENQSSSYCVIRCALDFLAALLCSTHSELVASWPQILNYGLVTNGCAPPCSWATDLHFQCKLYT